MSYITVVFQLSQPVHKLSKFEVYNIYIKIFYITVVFQLSQPGHKLSVFRVYIILIKMSYILQLRFSCHNLFISCLSLKCILYLLKCPILHLCFNCLKPVHKLF